MSEWIPISERMPENDRWVLLSFSNAPLPEVGFLETYPDGSAAFTNGSDTFISKGIFVNAWMELPERYEEKREYDDSPVIKDMMNKCEMEKRKFVTDPVLTT